VNIISYVIIVENAKAVLTVHMEKYDMIVEIVEVADFASMVTNATFAKSKIATDHFYVFTRFEGTVVEIVEVLRIVSIRNSKINAKNVRNFYVNIVTSLWCMN